MIEITVDIYSNLTCLEHLLLFLVLEQNILTCTSLHYKFSFHPTYGYWFWVSRQMAYFQCLFYTQDGSYECMKEFCMTLAHERKVE